MKASHQKYFKQVKAEMIRRAREVAERAFSYRHFKVGCAVLAWSRERNEYKIFAAANIKPLKDGPKQCAEAVAVSYAISNGYDLIVAIVVVGEPQADSESGIESVTLHPCYICRKFLSALPQVDKDTIVLTVQNHEGNKEWHTFGQILQIHDHGTDAD